MSLDQEALKYAKQRLQADTPEATVKTELMQKFISITEDAIASMYLETAKKDAPRPRFFRLTAQIVDKHVRYRAYPKGDEGATAVERDVSLKTFHYEMSSYYRPVHVAGLIEELSAKGSPELEIDSNADAAKVRFFELLRA